RELDLQAAHRGRVRVRVELAHALVGEDEPVVLGADRHAGALRRLAGAALLHLVAEGPLVRRDLALAPIARLVVPLVASPDLRARVALALVLLPRVVRRRRRCGLALPAAGALRAGVAIAGARVARCRHDLLRVAGPCRRRRATDVPAASQIRAEEQE